MENENQEHEQGCALKFDGSYGYGVKAELTIITKVGEEGEKEETFEFPYMFIDFSRLFTFDQMHLIKGFKVIKQEKPSTMKELGL